MIREKVVGSKVYEIVNEAMVKIPFEVVRIIGWGEVDDFCEHYIIKDASGKEKEVRLIMIVAITRFILRQVDILRWRLSGEIGSIAICGVMT